MTCRSQAGKAVLGAGNAHAFSSRPEEALEATAWRSWGHRTEQKPAAGCRSTAPPAAWHHSERLLREKRWVSPEGGISGSGSGAQATRSDGTRKEAGLCPGAGPWEVPDLYFQEGSTELETRKPHKGEVAEAEIEFSSLYWDRNVGGL